VNGKFLTTLNSNNLGISVKHVEFLRDKVGKIVNFDEGFVGIQWHGTNKVKRYTFLKSDDDDDKARFMFRFHCKKDADSTEEIKVAENKPVDKSTDEFFDAVEDEDTSISVEEEDPEYVMLSSPSAEIVDVEKDNGHDQEEKIIKRRRRKLSKPDTVTCSYCHSFPCNNGKFISFHKETLLGCVVAYTGLDEEYFGCIGTIVAHRKGSFLIRWMGSEDCIQWPIFKLLPETGKVNFQFKFYCNKEMIEINGFIQEEEELIEASEEAQDKCSNCISFPCRDGQYLMDFSEVRTDLRVKYVGNLRLDLVGKDGTVSKVRTTTFNIETFGEKMSHRLIYYRGDDETGVGELQFLYSCAFNLSEELAEANAFNQEDQQVFSFSRCVTKTSFFHVHEAEADKHRIIISVDRDILLYGVGLTLKSSPKKVLLTLQVQSDSVHGEWNKTVRHVAFHKDDVSVDSDVLQFPGPVLLSSAESYLLMLSFDGGESYLYRDGKETVNAVIDSQNKVQFKFATYKDDEVTNVNEGVINKLFFRHL